MMLYSSMRNVESARPSSVPFAISHLLHNTQHPCIGHAHLGETTSATFLRGMGTQSPRFKKTRHLGAKSWRHTNSFLFLVVMPGATSSILATSSDALVTSNKKLLFCMARTTKRTTEVWSTHYHSLGGTPTARLDSARICEE